MVTQKAGLVQASKSNPCPHCGKTSWCYFLGDEISVCKKEQPPAVGWEDVGKFDTEGSPMYVRQREKPAYTGEKKTTYYPYELRDDSSNLRVRRIDSANKEKDIKPEHFDTATNEWKTGFGPYNRSDIRIYRYEETRKAIESGLPIIICEGEGKVDALRQKGLAACCNIGGSRKWRKTDTMDLVGVKEIYIAPDCDKPGIEHAKLLLKEFPQAKFLLPYKDSPRWENIPEKHGVDIKNYLDDYPSLSGEEIIQQLSVEAADAPFLDKLEFPKFDSDSPKLERNYENNEPREVAKIYTQKALDELYQGHWIAVGGEIYKWNGTHYELQAEESERPRIARWLNKYSEFTRRGPAHNRAKTGAVSEVFSWAVSNFTISPDKVNPAGLNCRNGVVEIRWEGKRAVWELLPHSPEKYYIYCSDIDYDPQIDKADCEKLLSCLPAPQRKIFLQTIAAALDLPTVRKYRGRMVRLLVAYGSGSNGKDTLREAIEIIFGRGMTAASLSDFQAYDQGRKFPLAKLDGSLINWPSENSQFATLDNIQSIKQFATGDPLWIEKKNKDEYRYNPRAIGIFSCNDLPIIRGANEAIRSRWAFLKFPYTFKENANPALGEIEVDPRFKYDSDFLKSKVAPALLNEILAALQTLLEEGINYEPCAEALEEAQQEGNHLRQFAKDVGLVEAPGQKVFVNDLWEKLKAWYLETGTAEKEEGRERLLWNEFPNKYDKPIKAPNQIRARFGELFKCAFGKESLDRERRGQAFLSGICFSASLNCLDKFSEAVEAVVEPVSSQFSLILQGCEAVKPILGEVIQFLQNSFSAEEKAEICKAICQCESKSDSVRDFDETPVNLPEPVSAEPTEKFTLDEEALNYLVADLEKAAKEQSSWDEVKGWVKFVEGETMEKAWPHLSKEAKTYFHSIKPTTPEPAPEPTVETTEPEPEVTPEPQPAPAQQPEIPPPGQLNDRVKSMGHWGLTGTITHIYEGKQAGKVMVEWDAKCKGEPKTSEIMKISALELFHRKPRWEKNPSEGKHRPGPIHRFTNFMPGQTFISPTGRQIGKILKGCSGGLIILDFASGEEKKLKYDDINLMQYQREWRLPKNWEEGYKITDIPGKKATYCAVLLNVAGSWRCHIVKGEDETVTVFIGTTPKIYTYNEAKDWLESCGDSFLKNE